MNEWIWLLGAVVVVIAIPFIIAWSEVAVGEEPSPYRYPGDLLGFKSHDEPDIAPLEPHDWGVAGREPLSYRELQLKLAKEEAKNLRLCRHIAKLVSEQRTMREQFDEESG